MGQRSSASNRFAGESKPSRLRGRAFSFAATCSRSCCVNAPIDTPFGKYCRNKRLVFSLVPRCHGLRGSAKYTARPVFAVYDDVTTLLIAHDRLGTYLSVPATPDALGARLQRALGDAYQIRTRIATGGMASVYLADDVRHARQVAIKVFTFDDEPEALDDSCSDRFLAEIRTTARLQHPNIVPLFDSGAAAGCGTT